MEMIYVVSDLSSTFYVSFNGSGIADGAFSA